jgi:phosphoribosylanthranilate isomerase
LSIWVKICGITSIDDALAAADAGADAIGVNLVESSKRCIDRALAARIAGAVEGRVEVVAVIADLPLAELGRVRQQTAASWLQLHGHESPDALLAALPAAFKAVAVAGDDDVTRAREYAGERLLTDAKVAGVLGGSGQTFDWSLVEELSRERPLILAGGLTPDNVADAIRSVRPFGVDTASGVEGDDPRRKDHHKVHAFVRRAREAI